MCRRVLTVACFTALLPFTMACIFIPNLTMPVGSDSDPAAPGDAATDDGVTVPPNLVEQSETLTPVDTVAIPEAVADRVKQTFADDTGVPVNEVVIERYSRETWSDGCLGLGGLAESCLAALTEGWQVEVVYTETQNRAVYRTDLTGEQVRRSEQAHNLPPSLQQRLFVLTDEQFDVDVDALTVTDASPELWSGCMGVASPDAVCAVIGIYGWRATISDDQQQWIYHTDLVGNDIRLASHS